MKRISTVCDGCGLEYRMTTSDAPATVRRVIFGEYESDSVDLCLACSARAFDLIIREGVRITGTGVYERQGAFLGLVGQLKGEAKIRNGADAADSEAPK